MTPDKPNGSKDRQNIILHGNCYNFSGKGYFIFIKTTFSNNLDHSTVNIIYQQTEKKKIPRKVGKHLVRKDMDVYKQERLSNVTRRHKLK